MKAWRLSPIGLGTVLHGFIAFATVGSFALIAASCSAPDARGERPPGVTLPQSWSSPAQTATTEATIEEGTGGGAVAEVTGEQTAEEAGEYMGAPAEEVWWSAADDTARALVDEAVANNPDLARTGARLLAAVGTAELITADGDVMASLGLGAARTKTNFIGFPFVAGVPVSRVSTYDLSLDISWEPDLWGRLAAGEQAALSDVQAAAADLAAARLSLVGATLNAWYGLLEAAAQRALAEETLRTWNENAALVDRRHRLGLRPALDRRTVAANRAAAEARWVDRQRLEQEAARSLEILLGRYPAAELAATDTFPSWAAPPEAGVPAELLHRRADLVAAEARLRSAELRVDEARADFYPRFTLTGSVGRRGQHFSDVLDDDFSIWSLMGGVVQPLVDGGRRQSRYDVMDAQAQEALSGFQSILLAAMAEVESLLAAEIWLADGEAALSEASHEADEALVLAQQRYRSGLINLITLLDAQRSSQQAASAWLGLRFARLRNRILLHLALGGGFDVASLGPDNGAAS